MITKCANPNCRVRPRYLDHGRLFVTNHPARQSSREAPATNTEYFWLCDACSEDADLEIYIPRFDVFLGSEIVGAVELSQRGCA